MSALSLIPALIFALLGLALIVYFIKVIGSSLFGDGVSWIDKYRLKQKENVLVQADTYIASGDLPSASMFLKSAFFLDQARSDVQILDRISTHHIAILGRVISIADSHNMHLENLAIVEDLLSSRMLLMRSFMEKRSGRDALKKKGHPRGGTAPEWALAEFNRSMEDIKDKLNTNRKSLESQIAKLFSALVNAGRSDEVTYH